MNKKVKILILEDKEVDYNLILTEIKRGNLDFEIHWTLNEKDYIDALKNYKPDLIITDYNLPSYNGLKAIKQAKEYEKLIPIIVVTGSINEDTAVECIKAGACDYVIKEHLKRLVPAIKHALSEKELLIKKEETEEKLKRSEETYRLLFENNPHPMWVYDLETLKFLAVNNAAINKYGYSKEEFLTLCLKDIRPKEDIELLLEDIKRDSKTISYSGEWRHKSKDGKIFLVEIISHKIDFNGRNAKLVLINDITERRRTEEKLINQLKIFDEVQDAIIVTDANYNITFWNKAAENIYGFNSQEVIGKNELEILATEFLDIDKNDFYKILKEQKVVRLKLLQKNKDGKPIYIDSIINLFYDIDGLINGYVAVNRDITKEKQIEFSLKSAKEKAEEANKLKTYFLNNVSHELRTPLVPIITAAEILIEEMNNEDLKKLAESILLGGKRLKNTIAKILELTDLEALEGKVSFDKVNLVEIINKEIKKYEEKAKEKQLEFQFQYKNENIISLTEKNYIIKILDQLVENAINFTEKGFVLIKVENFSEEWNRIIVQDSGIGIPIEKQKVIFDPFRQSSEGYNRRYEGTGLGLTLVKKYVELLNCKILIESIPNIGTSVDILIPSEKTNTKKEEFNILFVDDDIESLNIYKRILKSDYNYDLISNVSEAKVITINKKYDLIFLDINLSSNYTGFELLDYLRTYPHLKKTYFVALTAYASKTDAQRFYSAGFNKVMIKPFRKNDLIELIEERIRENK